MIRALPALLVAALLAWAAPAGGAVDPVAPPELPAAGAVQQQQPPPEPAPAPPPACDPQLESCGEPCSPDVDESCAPDCDTAGCPEETDTFTDEGTGRPPGADRAPERGGVGGPAAVTPATGTVAAPADVRFVTARVRRSELPASGAETWAMAALGLLSLLGGLALRARVAA